MSKACSRSDARRAERAICHPCHIKKASMMNMEATTTTAIKSGRLIEKRFGAAG